MCLADLVHLQLGKDGLCNQAQCRSQLFRQPCPPLRHVAHSCGHHVKAAGWVADKQMVEWLHNPQHHVLVLCAKRVHTAFQYLQKSLEDPALVNMVLIGFEGMEQGSSSKSNVKSQICHVKSWDYYRAPVCRKDSMKSIAKKNQRDSRLSCIQYKGCLYLAKGDCNGKMALCSH